VCNSIYVRGLVNQTTAAMPRLVTTTHLLTSQGKGARHVKPPHGVPLDARALLQVGGRGAGLLRLHVRGEALGTLRTRRLDQRCLVRVRVSVLA
jgi:hypothetical protein